MVTFASAGDNSKANQLSATSLHTYMRLNKQVSLFYFYLFFVFFFHINTYAAIYSQYCARWPLR